MIFPVISMRKSDILTRSMRAMNARITSVAETLRVRIMRASFFAPA